MLAHVHNVHFARHTEVYVTTFSHISTYIYLIHSIINGKNLYSAHYSALGLPKAFSDFIHWKTCSNEQHLDFSGKSSAATWND